MGVVLGVRVWMDGSEFGGPVGDIYGRRLQQRASSLNLRFLLLSPPPSLAHHPRQDQLSERHGSRPPLRRPGRRAPSRSCSRRKGRGAPARGVCLGTPAVRGRRPSAPTLWTGRGARLILGSDFLQSVCGCRCDAQRWATRGGLVGVALQEGERVWKKCLPSFLQRP